ncbi:MAG: hypothetical protein AAF471_06240 [Myxococcota bacterium]
MVNTDSRIHGIDGIEGTAECRTVDSGLDPCWSLPLTPSRGRNDKVETSRASSKPFIR